jgi:hypothetical protein
MAGSMRLRLAGCGWGIVVLLGRLRERGGHEPRTRNSARSQRRAFEECAASFIMLAHA